MIICQTVVLFVQFEEDFQVDKMKSTYKIDVVDALIDAFYDGMYAFEDYAITNNPTWKVEHMSQEAVLAWLKNPESGLLEEY